ncbi:MAG: discoidin domain-containing protein [Candidatus Thiodiazotropha endolucinida]
MRKRIIPDRLQDSHSHNHDWLNLNEIAEVEITSEDSEHPIESALLLKETSGWLASRPGKQTIRLLFSEPQSIRLVRLKFTERQTQRTQQYQLRYSLDGGRSFQEIARQQWNFSPQGSTSETEEHQVDLTAVTLLELVIIPDISGGDAIASLSQFRLA